LVFTPISAIVFGMRENIAKDIKIFKEKVSGMGRYL
jgi:hypothetical protein